MVFNPTSPSVYSLRSTASPRRGHSHSHTSLSPMLPLDDDATRDNDNEIASALPASSTSFPGEEEATTAHGAIFCTQFAQSLVGTIGQFSFLGYGSFTGRVCNFIVREDLGGAIEHVVRFEEDGTYERSWYRFCFEAILLGHQEFMQCSAPTAFASATPLSVSSLQSTVPTLPSPSQYSIPVPVSIASFPLRYHPGPGLPNVAAKVVERLVNETGEHRWRLSLPTDSPDSAPVWIDTSSLFRCFDQAKAANVVRPSRKVPIVSPTRHVTPLCLNGNGWTVQHPLVGTALAVHLTTALADLGREKADAKANGRVKPLRKSKPITSVMVAAAFICPNGGRTQFFARVVGDLSVSVFILADDILADAAYAYDSGIRDKGKRIKRVVYNCIRPGPQLEGTLPDVSPGNPSFRDAIASLPSLLPDGGPKDFFQAGFVVASNTIPKKLRGIYRRGLKAIADAIIERPEDVGGWYALMLYDAMVLSPVRDDDEVFSTAFERRLVLFLAGDFKSLLREVTVRDAATLPPPPPSETDPRDARAAKGQSELFRNHSIGGASRALDAPLGGGVIIGANSAAFSKLNPSVGDLAPPPPPMGSYGPCQGGGDMPPREVSHPRPVNLLPVRRPFTMHNEVDPSPIILSTVQVVAKARSLDCAKASGLSGTSNKLLKIWFSDADPTSDALTAILNLITAGKVPEEAASLLISGRGVVIPKDEAGGLRPIVVGHVLLRLVGSLALSLLRPEIITFFLKPKPLQFGQFLPGGCELMAAAIRAHLEANPDHIDISCDAKNAFNSWCRTRCWGPLRQRFPKLYSLARLLYGGNASIIFPEPGRDVEEILNSVGSRQGCPWGSFLYCLSIHASLEKLAAEFPDLLIVAYADDVHIVGPPGLAVRAYHRWASLYNSELQGELRNDKGRVFSPNVSHATLLSVGLPPDMEVVSDGTRILGVPVGSVDFQKKFMSSHLDSLEDTFQTLGRMSSLNAQFVVAQRSLAHRSTHIFRTLFDGGDPAQFISERIRYDALMSQVPKRVVGRTFLNQRATTLVDLPLRHGGIGLRSWASSADVGFLASYVLASKNLPILFPYLADYFPDVRRMVPHMPGSSMSLAGAPLLPSPPSHAAAAARALGRLLPSSPGILEKIDPVDLTCRKLQHSMAQANDDYLAARFHDTLLDHNGLSSKRHQSYYLSSKGDAHTFATVPTDSHSTHGNEIFPFMLSRRLLLKLKPFQMEEASVCPGCKVLSPDPYGDHAVTCNSSTGPKTKLWHDPLVRVFQAVCSASGHRARAEVTGHIVLGGNMRPDGVKYSSSGHCIVTDVRTCNPTDKIPRSCTEEGVAADNAESTKNAKWDDVCSAQGDRFVPLAFEAGGRIGCAALALTHEITHSSGGTLGELSGLTSWSLQRLHSVNAAGVAALIRARTPVLSGPGFLSARGTISYAPPPIGNSSASSRLLLSRNFSRPKWAANIAVSQLSLCSTRAATLGAPVIGVGRLAPFSGIALSNPQGGVFTQGHDPNGMAHSRPAPSNSRLFPSSSASSSNSSSSSSSSFLAPRTPDCFISVAEKTTDIYLPPPHLVGMPTGGAGS